MKAFFIILTLFSVSMSAIVCYEVQSNNDLAFSNSSLVDSYDIPSKCGKCGKYHLPGVPCLSK